MKGSCDTAERKDGSPRLDAAIQSYWERRADGTFDSDVWRREFADVAEQADAWLADYAAIQDLWRERRSSPENDRSPPDLLPLPYSLEKYELEEVLGWGGMGVVYRAWQASLKRHVAVKVIRRDKLAKLSADEREQWLRRFRFEVETVTMLDRCDHVATIVDAQVEGDVVYYVMRLLDGPNLSDYVRDRPMPPAEAARYMEQVARTVFEIHKRGVLHLDIKPLNILLDGNPPRPFVTDFGLARSVRLGRGDSDAAVGTPRYMAPEQFGSTSPTDSNAARTSVERERDALAPIVEPPVEPSVESPAAPLMEPTWATDVYALGATLVHVLCGGPPPGDASTPQAATQRWKELRLDGVDADLTTICRKCLAPRAADRYASAGDLADDLQRYIAHRPIHASRVSALRCLWLWTRRNPTLALVLSALFVMVTLFAYHRREVVRREQAQHDLLIEQQATIDRQYRRQLALVDAALADVDEPKRSYTSVARAAQSLREAQQLMDALSSDGFESEDVAWRRLETHFRLGQLYLRHGRLDGVGTPDETVDNFSKAAAICRRLESSPNRAVDARTMRWKCERQLAAARLARSQPADLTTVERDLSRLVGELRAIHAADVSRSTNATGSSHLATQASSFASEQSCERELAKCLLLWSELAERLKNSTLVEEKLVEAQQLLEERLARASAAEPVETRPLTEDLARCLELLAKHCDRQLNREKAADYARRNVALRKGVAERNPEDELARREYLIAQVQAARLDSEEDGAAAELRKYESLFTSIRQLRQNGLKIPQQLADEAVVLERMAGLHDRFGKVTQAEQEYEQSYRLLEDATRLDPTDRETADNLATVDRHLARVKFRRGESKEAMVHAERSINRCRELLEQAPSDPRALAHLASAHYVAADLLVQLGDYREAKRHSIESLTNYDGLRRTASVSAKTRSDAIRARLTLATSSLHLGDHADAVRNLDVCGAELSELDKDATNRSDVLRLRSSTSVGFSDIAVAKKDWPTALARAEEAIVTLSELLTQTPDNSFHLRQLTVAISRAGDAARDAGDIDAALRFTSENVAACERLAQLGSDNDDAQFMLASAYLRHAKLLAKRGDRREAVRLTQASLAIRERRLNRSPQNSRRIRESRLAWHDLAALLEDEGRNAEAIPAWINAIHCVERLIARNLAEQVDIDDLLFELGGFIRSAEAVGRYDDVLNAREKQLVHLRQSAVVQETAVNCVKLAGALKRTGILARDLGAMERAETLFVEALTTYERLGRVAPDNPDWRLGRIETLVELGRTEYERYRVSAARRWYERARAEADILDAPADGATQPHRAMTPVIGKLSADIRRCLADCDDAEASIADLARAEANVNRVKESRPLSLSLLMRVAELSRRGEMSAARDTAARLASLATESDSSLMFQAARAYAICAAAVELRDSVAFETDASRACELLIAARDKSLFTNGVRFSRLKLHEDLHVLRTRRDFQQFLCETNPDAETPATLGQSRTAAKP